MIFHRDVTFSKVATLLLICILLITVIQSILLIFTEDIVQLKINLILQFTLLMLFGCWSFKKSGTYLSAPFIFVVALYFWHSPFLTGHYLALGELFEYTGHILSYGENFVPKASAMVALSMTFAIAGVLYGFSQQKQKIKGKRQSIINCSWPCRGNFKIFYYKSFGGAANKYAWIYFLAFLLTTLFYLKFEGSATFDDTYLSLYTDSSGSFLYRLYQSTKFFGVVAILMMIATVRTKKTFIIASSLTIGLIFINILMGSRSMPFIYALAFVLCIDCFIKRISFKQLIVIAVSASAISFIIDHTRQLGLGLKIFDFSSTERYINLFHIFWNAGGTIETVLRTMEFSAESGLIYGQSIADAVIYLFPRAIVDGLGFQTGFITPSEWLVERSSDVPVGGGLGYSLVAEAYLNFGVYGCFLFAVIGWFLAKKYFDFIFSQNIFAALHAFNVAIIFSLHMRSEIGVSLRSIIYGFIFIEIFRSLAKRYEKHLTIILMKA